MKKARIAGFCQYLPASGRFAAQHETQQAQASQQHGIGFRFGNGRDEGVVIRLEGILRGVEGNRGDLAANAGEGIHVQAHGLIAVGGIAGQRCQLRARQRGRAVVGKV